PQLGAQRKAVQPREHHIQQDHVGLLVDRAVQARFPVTRREHTIPLGGKAILERRPHGQLILDDQNALVHATGSSMLNRLPWPNALSTTIRPRCASTMCFTM